MRTTTTTTKQTHNTKNNQNNKMVTLLPASNRRNPCPGNISLGRSLFSLLLYGLPLNSEAPRVRSIGVASSTVGIACAVASSTVGIALWSCVEYGWNCPPHARIRTVGIVFSNVLYFFHPGYGRSVRLELSAELRRVRLELSAELRRVRLELSL